MKKFLLTIGFLFTLATVGNAQSQCVNVEEIDGSPKAPCIRELKVTNGTLSCPTINRCVLTISGGGGGSPGGSSGQVQWNDTGSFNGTSGLTATATTVTIVSGVSATFSNTSPLISATNSANSASVQIAIWQGDRATVTGNDEAYFTFRLSDDGGGQTEVARLTWAIPTATAAAENGRLDFSVMTAGTLAKELQLSGADLAPSTNDGLALGTSVNQFSDLFLASGAVIDFANGNAVITHSSGILTVSTGDLRVTTAGTNTASVVTVGGTQTLSSKTLASPTVTGNISAEATSRLIYGSNEYRYTNTTGPAFYDDTTGNILTFNVQSLAANRTVTFPNSSLTIAGIDVANAWADGVKQTFNPDATNAGINVGSVAGDPSAPANGDLWYDSTANELTARINGANVALGSGGGGGITVGTTTVTSGTATRLFYETAGNVVGQVSGVTSDGTNVTAGSGNLRATSPRITTGINDANGNTMLAFSPTGSATQYLTIANNTATNAVSLTASSPTVAASAQAGTPFNLTASPAIAGNVNVGAAAGGSVTITAGAAARLTSGNANGGQIFLIPGAGIGTGVTGNIGLGGTTSSFPAIFPSTYAGQPATFFVDAASGSTTMRPIATGRLLLNTTVSGIATPLIALNTGNNWVSMASGIPLQWNASATNADSAGDLILRRGAAANLAFGNTDAAAPVAQILSVQNVVGGTSNTAGANWTINASRGTGTGAGGSIIFQTAPAGGSGTTQNTLAAAFTVNGDGSVSLKSVTFANLPTQADGKLIYCSDCTAGSSPCTSGGSGALAVGQNSAWKCF